jgi:hypothetical protein
MHPRDMLDSQQLALLTTILDDICRAAGIESQGPEREEIAGLVLHFYGHGYRTADELRAALDEAMQEEQYR